MRSMVRAPAPDITDPASRLLYEDAHLLVLDKPAGIPVHGGPRGGPSVEDWLDDLRLGFVRRPELAHRLDADTSGCLILGRHPRALKRLGELFTAGTIDKTYWAVVARGPAADSGVIDAPLSKVTQTQGWHMRVGGTGAQRAISDWRVLGRARDGRAWLEVRPRTGRTHQVRVHCAHLGSPILGEMMYGDGAARVPLHLHARALVIPYHAEREPISVEAEPPEHMHAALRACRS
jgi:RluA family pseudouridine synthase